MTGYLCPVHGCERSFKTVDSLIAHVAGAAQNDDAHAEQRDSDDHTRHWYLQHCEDAEQRQLF